TPDPPRLPALPALTPLAPLFVIWLCDTEMPANTAPAPSQKTPFCELLEKTLSRAVKLAPDLACRPLALPDNRTWSRVALTRRVGELVIAFIPSLVLSLITVFLTCRF